MPFVYVPDEEDDGSGGPPPLDQYQYETPFASGRLESVHFALEPLAPEAAPGLREWEREHAQQRQRLFAIVIPELEKAGVRRAYCRYDGGHDEGFAWADYFELKDGVRIGPRDLAARLHDARLPDRLYGAEVTRRYTVEQTMVDVVHSLCSEWAALLMGEGFGTGDYSMYGAFMVDLEARTVTDDRVADPQGHRASKLASW